jgi:hypothetical protein
MIAEMRSLVELELEQGVVCVCQTSSYPVMQLPGLMDEIISMSSFNVAKLI